MKKQNWFKKHEKAAAAGFCAVVLGITGVTAYQLQAVHAETYCWKEDSGASSEKELQEGRAERLDKIREKVLELEKYDVTFDNKEQAVYYDGRKAVSYTHLDVYKRQD